MSVLFIPVFLALLAVVCPPALAAPPSPAGETATAQHQRLEGSFELAPGAALKVTNRHGRLYLRRATDQRVSWVAHVQQPPGDHQLAVVGQVPPADGSAPPLVPGGAVELRARFDAAPRAVAPESDAPREFEPRIDLTVLVPAGSALVAATRAERIDAKGLRGPVELWSESGEVRYFGGGPVRVTTESGEISATLAREATAAGETVLETVSAAIHLVLRHNPDVAIRAETGGAIRSDFETAGGAAASPAIVRLGSGAQRVLARSRTGPIDLVDLH